MRIQVQELRVVTERLLKHLEDTGRQEFSVSEDYYWHVGQDELYDPTCDPKNLTLGQLSDDWKELAAIASGDAPPIGYALVWLAAILRVVGEKSGH